MGSLDPASAICTPPPSRSQKQLVKGLGIILAEQKHDLMYCNQAANMFKSQCPI